MGDAKAKVTLIGTGLAKTGLEFVYEGEADECGQCKVKKACNNLHRGRKYRIVNVRPTKHECHTHLNGAVTVEVIEAPVTALIGADGAIVNSRIKYEFSCNKVECRSYELCHPDGIVEGEKYVVGEVLGNAPDICEKGRALKLVDLRPV
jgi:uncharacterized protein (UPF0179 family)